MMTASLPAASPSQDVARRLMDDGYAVVAGLMTPDDVQSTRADLDRVLQELLGYNIYPPFVGYVDGRHPRRVLSAEA